MDDKVELFEDYRVVHTVVIPGSRSDKKDLRRPRVQTVKCKLKQCSFRERNECLLLGSFCLNECPYGHLETELGPTGPSEKATKWFAAKIKEHRSIPTLVAPNSNTISIIGDFLYFDFPHVMCKYVHRSCWSVEFARLFIQHRPMSFSGELIELYQKEVVPKLIESISAQFPEIYSKLIDQGVVRPAVRRSNVGRRARVKTLVPGTVWTQKMGADKVTWIWNGETMTSTSPCLFTWRVRPETRPILNCVPTDEDNVIVESESWVNENTRYMD